MDTGQNIKYSVFLNIFLMTIYGSGSKILTSMDYIDARVHKNKPAYAST